MKPTLMTLDNIPVFVYLFNYDFYTGKSECLIKREKCGKPPKAQN